MADKKVSTKSKTSKEADFDIREIYTPLSVAKKEIWRRWNDKELRKKVEDFLGGDVPKFLKKKPNAVMVRYITSPGFEFFNFIDLARIADLDIVLAEYTKDKFVAKNPDKYNLCKMFFHNGKNKNGDDNIFNLKVVNFNKYEGKNFDKIKTLWGEDLIDFHHKVLKKAVPGCDKKIFDISEWFNKNRDKKHAEYYYLRYLALFLCHGVLFENFLLNKNEKDFTKKKVLPSFVKLQEMFGVKPLIVPLEPFEDETHICWWHYPAKIEKIAKEMAKTR